jgi:hypothetical protein
MFVVLFLSVIDEIVDSCIMKPKFEKKVKKNVIAPVTKPILSRKERRKQERKEKKAKKNEFFMRVGNKTGVQLAPVPESPKKPVSRYFKIPQYFIHFQFLKSVINRRNPSSNGNPKTRSQMWKKSNASNPKTPPRAKANRIRRKPRKSRKNTSEPGARICGGITKPKTKKSRNSRRSCI